MRHVLQATACALLLSSLPTWADDDPVVENMTAKYQYTYGWQYHPSFNNGTQALAPVNNSLLPIGERMYTYTLTAHWGMRVWTGGELYFDPELAAGVPFSGGVIGFGGITNGEITRASGSSPTLYRQRLFLRQTWNEGGGTERVESDFNQLAGEVDKNRTVLTVGNFSVLDVFDDNAYAKDPRTQFTNWANWTYAAYDYAADARGFTWGAALEWYRDDWAYRVGRFILPDVPNGLTLDFSIRRHYADQAEIEHSHTWRNRPGKVRVLAWRDHTVMGSFDDASKYMVANNAYDTQAIVNVRNGDKTKFGLGVNLEQELSDNTGYFMRYMWADGRTETDAFTEADRSFSTGLLVNGRAWGRPEDSFGIALAQNGLSAQRRNYLALGGVSFFIGDGYLSNYKPETIFETFYSLQACKGVWTTFDYQKVFNPAYNGDRGPVDVYGVRLHAEF